MANIRWLYSGIVTGWWSYDKSSNSKLNEMYVNYCKQNNLDCSQFISVDVKKDYDKTNEFVDFSSLSSKFSDSDGYNSDSSNGSNYSNNSNNTAKSNLIIAKDGNYKIDFNRMIQYLSSDVKKKRNIMYVEIPDSISQNDILVRKFLIERGVKGIAGQLF